MTTRTWAVCVCAALGVAAWSLAGPIEDADALLAKKDFSKVDEVLKGELSQPKPSVQALKVSLQAATQNGQLVTAGKRVSALIKATDSKDAELLLAGAQIADQLGDEDVAHVRYHTYARLVDQKSESLQKALRYVLAREAYPEEYRKYIKHFGASEESWTMGKRVLARPDRGS